MEFLFKTRQFIRRHMHAQTLRRRKTDFEQLVVANKSAQRNRRSTRVSHQSEVQVRRKEEASPRSKSLLQNGSQSKRRRLLQCIRSTVRSLAFQYHHRLSIRSESLLRRRLKHLWFFYHRRRLKQLSLVGNRRRKRFWCFTVDTSNANSTSAILWATGNSTSVISTSSFALSTQTAVAGSAICISLTRRHYKVSCSLTIMRTAHAHCSCALWK